MTNPLKRGAVLVLFVIGCGSATIQRGEAGQHCYPNGTCNGDLVCLGGEYCFAQDAGQGAAGGAASRTPGGGSAGGGMSGSAGVGGTKDTQNGTAGASGGGAGSSAAGASGGGTSNGEAGGASALGGGASGGAGARGGGSGMSGIAGSSGSGGASGSAGCRCETMYTIPCGNMCCSSPPGTSDACVDGACTHGSASCS